VEKFEELKKKHFENPDQLCPFGERAWRQKRSAGSAWPKSRLGAERTQRKA